MADEEHFKERLLSLKAPKENSDQIFYKSYPRKKAGMAGDPHCILQSRVGGEGRDPTQPWAFRIQIAQSLRGNRGNDFLYEFGCHGQVTCHKNFLT